ncbi:hypothetical protein PPYR_02811 [Photinus pyralis]|uniref:Peptidase S1 domain-containing protein n=2 Tax=Photinus pyralis TaxID=7054 RepID=A0A5N4A150_PHOPY|nr:trypsin-7-like [Photinus pyralis]KAB0791011.1 hypothetical protein PPYR_02811 [Photinus pyralis]
MGLLIFALFTFATCDYGPISDEDEVKRVIGGVATTIQKFPYQVSLEVNGKHLCGASLVKPHVVVTAAHCTLAYQAQQLTVRAGTTLKGKGGKVVNVFCIIEHPDFSPKTYDYDVAVGILESRLELSPTIRTIDLLPKDSVIDEHVLAYATGWGQMKPRSGSWSNRLRMVRVPKVSREKCQRLLRRKTVTPRMVCFGYDEGGMDACRGDSGGPITIDDELVGIISWGDGCAKPNKPGVYTDITNPEIYDFIEEFL